MTVSSAPSAAPVCHSPATFLLLVPAEPMAFLPSGGKSFILGRVDEAVSNELELGELGELAQLTITNEAESLGYDVSPETCSCWIVG